MQTKNDERDLDALLNAFGIEFHLLIEVGQAIGAENLNKMMNVLGGQKPHIPTEQNFWGLLEREQRNEQIRAKFKGNNYEQLASEFDLSPRQVREVIHVNRRRAPRKAEKMRPVKCKMGMYNALFMLSRKHNAPMHQVLMVAWQLIQDHHAAEFSKRLRHEFGEQLTLIDEAA